MKYAVIGDEDTILGFGIVGVTGYTVVDADEARQAFDKALAEKDIAIIIITEPVADMIRAEVDRYLFTERFPLVVEIPDRHGRQPGRPGIKDLVNAAIGIKL